MKQPQLKTTWDLSFLGRNSSDPKFLRERKLTEKKVKAFIKKWQGRKDYLQSPEVLKKALPQYEKLKSQNWVYNDEWFYFWLLNRKDQSSATAKAGFSRAHDFAIKLEHKLNFFELNISKIPPSRQNKFLQSLKLSEYKHFLEKLFQQGAHLLSEREEEIASLKSKTAYSNWVQMTSQMLSSEQRQVWTGRKKQVKSFSELDALFENENKKVRDSAAVAFNDILKNNLAAAEWEINSVLENRKVEDYLRGFSGPDSARLLEDDMEREVVEALIKAVTGSFKVSREFYKFKAKLLGVKKLAYHERALKYGHIELKYNFPQAFKLVHKVFGQLDSEFAEIFNSSFEKGLVDVKPGNGKSGGAFCVYNLKSQPVYVLLNHNNRLYDVLVMAHEFGHAINNELIRKKQNALNFATPTSTAEIASTFMEDFVADEVLKTADDKTRLSIMMLRLDSMVATIFRQIAAINFEYQLHHEYRQQGYLSAKVIGQMFKKHMQSYMGSSVTQSEGSENWWVYWSHFRAYFYNYTYSSGLLISKFLQQQVRQNPEFISKVKQFLSVGTSLSPKECLQDLGVDISKKSFWEQGLKQVQAEFAETKKLARKMGKPSISTSIHSP